MAALTTLPYSHEHYDSLPDIMDAAKTLASTGALVNGLVSSIGEIFVKHGVQDVFGLGLLHRHFDMEPAERLVAFGNVSLPWDVARNREAADQMQPTAWRFLRTGGVAPYEFVSSSKASAVVPDEARQTQTQKHDAFARELGGILREKGLDQLLGLCRVKDTDVGLDNRDPTVEYTSASGRASVTVPEAVWAQDAAQDAQDAEHGMIHAVWQFGTKGNGGPDAAVFRKCVQKCDNKRKGRHYHVHIKVKT